MPASPPGLCALLAADRARLRAHVARVQPRAEWLLLHPGFVAVALFRLASRCHAAGWPRTARLLAALNHGLTGADLHPASCIGPGLLIPLPEAVRFEGSAGRDCTLHPQSSVAPWHRAAPGRPRLGDAVEVGLGALLLGPISVGDGAVIGPRCLIEQDVPAGASALPLPVRARST
jgi:serine O-acetyltransferase